jgi:tRNA pseudouridine38-40 synthase
LAYEGGAYCGWQIQPNGVSIQQILEDAYEKVVGERIRSVAASRTDSGVHALGQVVCLRNPSRHGPDTLLRALNFHLPEDVVVVAADEPPDGFDPRRDACGKHYRYQLHTDRSPPLFERRLRWHLYGRLDVAAMQTAAVMLAGEHDFTAFRGAKCQAASPVRIIDRIGWSRDGPVLVLDVFGRGFLKQMVRNIVGTCVEIGRGRWSAGQMAEILASRDRRRAGLTAPACGLCLQRVYFDPDEYRRAWRVCSLDRAS